MFKLVSKYTPSGDQPQAIDKLVEGIKNGEKEQVLLGATGTGKTFTIANVIAKTNKPTLRITLSTLSLIMTIINQKPMFHRVILILKKILLSMMKLMS